MTMHRRQLLQSASAFAVNAISATSLIGLPLIAKAAPKYTLRIGNISQGNHPLNVALNEASKKISSATGGDVDLKVFANSQLGSENDMLTQTRAGGLDFFAASGITLSTLVPLSSINCLGFVFSNYDQVWKAMDGKVGKKVIESLGKANLYAFDKMWDNGFRQMTSSKKPIKLPEDLTGFKIRVPPSTLWTSMFKALGASPTPIPWGETYSALQTHVADGVENPLVGLYYANLFEVQKYLSMTNHMWDGYWIVSNLRSWQALPNDIRAVLERELNGAAIQQREKVIALNSSLRAELTSKGLEFFDVDNKPFKEALRKTSFYSEWRGRFGSDAWSSLEETTGRLV
jgi:tripartite ATP-independent transporter DctP family solute receptor